jgi:hypothetical protein
VDRLRRWPGVEISPRLASPTSGVVRCASPAFSHHPGLLAKPSTDEDNVQQCGTVFALEARTKPKMS